MFNDDVLSKILKATLITVLSCSFVVLIVLTLLIPKTALDAYQEEVNSRVPMTYTISNDTIKVIDDERAVHTYYIDPVIGTVYTKENSSSFSLETFINSNEGVNGVIPGVQTKSQKTCVANSLNEFITTIEENGYTKTD